MRQEVEQVVAGVGALAEEAARAAEVDLADRVAAEAVVDPEAIQEAVVRPVVEAEVAADSVDREAALWAPAAQAWVAAAGVRAVLVAEVVEQVEAQVEAQAAAPAEKAVERRCARACGRLRPLRVCPSM